MIALLSDIHGNLHALEAVLANMPKVSQVWVMGDMLTGLAFPCEVLDRLLNMDIPAHFVMGNHEDWLLRGYTKIKKGHNAHNPDVWEGNCLGTFVFDAIQQHHWDFIQNLPRTLPIETVPGGALLYHGSPSNIAGAIRTQDDAMQVAAEHPVKWLVGGHRHKSLFFRMGKKSVIVPGSVGNSQDGIAGVACYALIDEYNRAPKITFRHVAYDVEAAALALQNSPLPELYPGFVKAVIAEITTGRYYLQGLTRFVHDYTRKQLGFLPDNIPVVLLHEAERLWACEEWTEGRML